jgi:enterobacteria phage integrase
MLMPRKRPPFVACWRDRHGKIRVYFRKERGPRLPLPDTIGSNEFNAAYHAALTEQLDPPRQRLVRATPGTIGALIISYIQSAAYIGLRETSKTGYRSRIEMLRIQHGHRSIVGLSRERIVTGISRSSGEPHRDCRSDKTGV